MWAVFRRYAIKGYLSAVAIVLLALVLLISISMIVEDDLLTRGDLSPFGVLEIVLLRSIGYGYQLVPIAAFLGVLVWGALAAKHSELTALYVGGYSTWQIGRPIVGAALGMTLLTYLVGAVVMPWSTNRLIALRGLDSVAMQQQLAPEQWFKDGPYILYLPNVDSDNGYFLDVGIFYVNGSEIQEWYSAKKMTFTAGTTEPGWQLLDGQRFIMPESGQVEHYPFAQLPLSLSVKPADLLDYSGRPGQLNTKDLRASIARRERTGRVVRYHLYEYHQRLVYPFSLLVLVLISIPMALSPDKNRSLSGAIGSGTVVAGWAYGVTYLFRSIMSSGTMSPALAAWGALVVILAGAFLSYSVISKVFNH